MMDYNIIIKHFAAPKAKILIVDDSNVTLKVEEDMIKTYGINVTTAKSGKECLSLLTTEKYDIIFMDHMMPNMDGIETTLRIRNMKDEYFKKVIIIALTATITPNSSSMYLQNGFNDFLKKPLENIQLNKFLRTYLPRKYIIETAAPEFNASSFDKIKIKDVDTRKAIQNCFGNIDNYLSLLSVAYYEGKNKIKVIKNCAANKDIKNYTIEVHALKSVAELIGDMKLFELAKHHEIAGTEDDLKFILENVDFLLNSYNELLNNIKPVLPKENAKSTPKIKDFTNDYLLNLIEDIANAIDNFDLDSASEVLSLVLDYELTNSQITVLNKVKSYMNIFDYDNAYELITNFKYTLYNDYIPRL